MKYDQFIEAPGRLADELRFLAKAISDDETRYFMNFIHVEYVNPEDTENSRLIGVGCDGRRLHIVEPLHEAAVKVFGMKPGFYRFLKGTGKHVWIARCEEDPGQFPNWRRVVPTDEPSFTTTFAGFSNSARNTNAIELVKLYREFPEATAISLSYLKDLGVDTPWQVNWTAPDKAVVFKSGAFSSVIMPLHIQ